ncbi:aryl-alcohol dehydrogenase-like predicted oxidoreductase [Raoultella sp. BIGb0149]|uniref:aldo/keto reductase n=1 Tax=Raoultella TaxID=160674 RepID=UPI00105F497A|nr:MULTISPECIES: aldo/keto reductase [Raoultella]MCI1032146.1 aldo/keto reductase [Raoultella terrigena]TDQ26761.1 aryl-alcohol dehydrogenase-like predicted oxidoreductase [Raoultella sp. BIGb0149]
MAIETIHIAGISQPVSRIGLGTWAMGGSMWGGSHDEQSIATLHEALDRGINLIDTAPAYGFGHSEEVVGKALAGRRDRAIIATKVALDWDDAGRITRNSTPQRIRQEIEDSLRRLQTDYIDLYQVHWPDELVAVEETARVLETLQQQGKVRALGVSNYSPAQMDRFRNAAPLATLQPPLNLFERGQTQSELLPYAERHQLVVLAYGAICRGLLSGRMTPETIFGADDLRSIDPKFQPPRYAHYLAAVAALKNFAQQRFGKSVMALALRWVLDAGPTVALWGARRPQQLAGLEEVAGWQLTVEDKQEIDAILAQHIAEPLGAEFMAPPHRR